MKSVETFITTFKNFLPPPEVPPGALGSQGSLLLRNWRGDTSSVFFFQPSNIKQITALTVCQNFPTFLSLL